MGTRPVVRAAAAGLVLVLAAGCAAGRSRTEPEPPAPPASASATATRAAPDDLPRVMAAIGDSTTAAFLACGAATDCPQTSWATGSTLDSHARRLERLAGRPVEAHNLAVSGSRVADLPGQAEEAVGTGAAYVTILIGANDACRPSVEEMTPVDEYAADFRRTLDTLAEGLPRARLLVASLPDIGRLWDLGHDRPDVVAVWERYGICGALREDPAAVRARVAAYNGVMGAVCAAYRRCRWDGGAVFGYRFTLADISPQDDWHPNARGQQALADLTWRAGWWG